VLPQIPTLLGQRRTGKGAGLEKGVQRRDKGGGRRERDDHPHHQFLDPPLDAA